MLANDLRASAADGLRGLRGKGGGWSEAVQEGRGDASLASLAGVASPEKVDIFLGSLKAGAGDATGGWSLASGWEKEQSKRKKVERDIGQRETERQRETQRTENDCMRRIKLEINVISKKSLIKRRRKERETNLSEYTMNEKKKIRTLILRRKKKKEWE
jgi:hypothetical protein